MKFGIPAMIEYNPIEENIKLAKSLGLSFIELNLDLPYCSLSNGMKMTLYYFGAYTQYLIKSHLF